MLVMIEFPKYAKIKDCYCVCYFGPNNEYLLQLKLLQTTVEEQLPGLKLFFGCRDDKTHIFQDCERVLKVSELKMRRYDFAYIRELRTDGIIHPVEEFLNEAGIKNYKVKTKVHDNHTSRCVIITSGNYPTRPLERRYIEQIKRTVKEEGYDPELDTSIDNAGLVVGVESFSIFDAASQGIATRLVHSGIGTRLYENMFEFGRVINI